MNHLLVLINQDIKKKINKDKDSTVQKNGIQEERKSDS